MVDQLSATCQPFVMFNLTGTRMPKLPLPWTWACLRNCQMVALCFLSESRGSAQSQNRGGTAPSCGTAWRKTTDRKATPSGNPRLWKTMIGDIWELFLHLFKFEWANGLACGQIVRAENWTCEEDLFFY